MPDSIGPNGLTVQTASEITANLVAGLQAIYGADINVDQNSPDGQRIGILTQMAVDIRELLVSINNNFDPDQAVGVLLDERVSINNVLREGGTYTVQPIDIMCSQPVTLQGLDADFNDPDGTGYTVQDDAGNQFILAVTTTLPFGISTVDFRAAIIGAVNVPINTITNPVTIVLGVTSVNNSSSAITVGEAEETDPQLRVRRQASVANASNGYLNGLLAAIEALDGVTEAALYQNTTGITDANGTPAHTVWLVVSGGSSADIANTLYNKISGGAGMRGAVIYDITTVSNSLFVAQWDVPVAVPLYIQFDIKTTVPNFAFNVASIQAYIAANLTYGIGGFAETSAITAVIVAAITAQGGGGVPINVQISLDNATWVDYLAASTPASQFTVSASNITVTIE